MITREQYLKQRIEGNISMELCYLYYKENTSTPLYKTFHEFTQAFQIYMSFGFDLSQMINFYDKKYNINLLHNKQNEIIKIY